MTDSQPWDYLIIGSGFGGAVSGLRLVDKGYSVLMLEKGGHFAAEDFPKSNWNLKRWMWMPMLGFRGLFKMTFLPHITVLSGVGVGGGSLVYANTLPVPKDDFFEAPVWSGLASWKQELAPHYDKALEMLGGVPFPGKTPADEIMHAVAKRRGQEADFEPTTVAVYFGESGVTVPDPYFGGEGPERTGCEMCGACMTGCRHGAKNTLDMNYLYLAQKRGLQIKADTEVTEVRPRTGGGYEVSALQGRAAWFGRKRMQYTANNVIFAGGVLGTVPLLLDMKERSDCLPELSAWVGGRLRTNSEALIGVVSQKRDLDISKGVAITSILQTDAHSHLEPVRYGAGSGFFRTLMAPHVGGSGSVARILRMAAVLITSPIRFLRALLVDDWAKRTLILLYMRTLEGTLRLKRGRAWTNLFSRGIKTVHEEGERPLASMPAATELAQQVGEEMAGMPMSLVSETVLDIPTTAHILGGCTMGDSADSGVIDHQHRVFGYDGLYVIDGSAVSANPGVNPSLTITALAERAMSFIPDKAE